MEGERRRRSLSLSLSPLLFSLGGVPTPTPATMGVTGLWPLLEPVGRRINVETLSNKRLAIGEGEGRGHGA